MRTTLFFAIAIVITSLFSSCKKNETIAPIELQSEKTIDNTNNWLVGRLRIDGDDISLQDVFVTIDKYSVVITSSNFTATAPSSFQPNSEIVIGQFDIVQNGQLSTQNGTPVGVDKAFVRFVSAMETTLKYQKNSAHIILSAPHISVILLQVGQKNANALVNTSWTAIEFTQSSNVLEWVNGPRLTFGENFIETTFDGLTCQTYYENNNNAFKLNTPNGCSMNDKNTETMLSSLNGDYVWMINGDGNLEIKNRITRTKLILRPTLTISTTAITSNITIQ